MDQWIKSLDAKCVDLGSVSISGTLIKVDRENGLLRAVFRTPNAHCGMCAHAHKTYVHKY